MGVLLITALVLAVACAFIELKLVYSTPLKNWVRKGAAFGIIFSLTLSMIIGTVFGAAGLTIMLGGVITVVITEPIHGLIRSYKNKTIESKAKIEEGIQDLVHAWKPVWRLVVLCLKILTAPIWVPMKIRRWWLDHTNKANTQSTPQEATA